MKKKGKRVRGAREYEEKTGVGDGKRNKRKRGKEIPKGCCVLAKQKKLVLEANFTGWLGVSYGPRRGIALESESHISHVMALAGALARVGDGVRVTPCTPQTMIESMMSALWNVDSVGVRVRRSLRVAESRRPSPGRRDSGARVAAPESMTSPWNRAKANSALVSRGRELLAVWGFRKRLKRGSRRDVVS